MNWNSVCLNWYSHPTQILFIGSHTQRTKSKVDGPLGPNKTIQMTENERFRNQNGRKSRNWTAFWMKVGVSLGPQSLQTVHFDANNLTVHFWPFTSDFTPANQPDPSRSKGLMFEPNCKYIKNFILEWKCIFVQL